MNDVHTQSTDSLRHSAHLRERLRSEASTRPWVKPAAMVLVLGVVAAAAWFFFGSKGAGEAEGEAKPAARVETIVLQSQEIAQSLEAFGVIESAPAADLTTPATYETVVTKIHAVAGGHVKAGDVVMEIAPSPDSKLQYESAKTTLKLAEQSLAAAQERYDLKLATTQDLITAQQAERDARQKVASYEARGMGGDGKLHSPVTGIISKLDALAGALVPAGSPLFSVATANKFEARLSVESAMVSKLDPGQTVALQSTDRMEPVSVASVVRVVGASVMATTGSAEVRVPVPDSAPLLLGEHVKGIIQIAKKDAALVVPRSAVLPDDDKQVLFTVKDGKAVKHEVTLGLNAGDLVEVEAADLKAGDVVVTLGNYELNDGMAIQGPESADAKDDAKDDEKGGDAADEKKPAKGAAPEAADAKAADKGE